LLLLVKVWQGALIAGYIKDQGASGDINKEP